MIIDSKQRVRHDERFPSAGFNRYAVDSGADYLCEAIDPALALPLDNIELLVINDGSRDAGDRTMKVTSTAENTKCVDSTDESLCHAWEKIDEEYLPTIRKLQQDNPPIGSQISYFLQKIRVNDPDNLANHLVATRNASSIKIAFYCGYLTVGGADRVLTTLANHLAGMGYQIYVITLNQPGVHFTDVYSFSDNVTRVIIDSDDDWMDRLVALAQLLGIYVWVSNNKIDKSCLFNFSGKFRNANIHYLQSDHYSFFLPLSRPETYVWYDEEMKSYQNCSVVIACNSFIANAYKYFLPNVATMHNPVSYRSDKAASLLRTKKNILCVGRFYDTIKRFDRSLLVFNELLKLHPDARLIVVGRVDEDIYVPSTNAETIGEMIARLGFSGDQLLFVGEKEDVGPYFNDASVLMLTSENEAFGMVLAEAGVFGVPSVLFDIPGLEDIIIDNFNGFVVKQNDICGMAQKLSVLLSSEPLRMEIGNNARMRAEIFSIANVCDRWDKLIKLLTENTDQDIINAKLDRDFNVKCSDWFSVGKKVIQEYDRHVSMIVSKYLSLFDNHIINNLQQQNEQLRLQYRNLENSRSVRFARFIKKHLLFR